MKAYQVVENGKPLEQREIETPEPQGNEVLLKTVACGVATPMYIFMMGILT